MKIPSKVAEKMLNITPAFRHFHDHRIDPAYGDRYFKRLPDGLAVPIDRYEERLRAYRAAEAQPGEEDGP